MGRALHPPSRTLRGVDQRDSMPVEGGDQGNGARPQTLHRALAKQHVGVAERPDDLFWLKALLQHDLPPLENGSTATLPLDQFLGARSECAGLSIWSMYGVEVFG